MIQFEGCPHCNGPLPKCWCDVPGFVTYRGYTRAQALRSVGQGWAKLIDRLFDAKPQDTVIIQVKEKFGGLRFYTDESTEEFQNLIDEAEEESYKTCQNCGTAGTLNTDRYWVVTLCTKCLLKRENNEKTR